LEPRTDHHPRHSGGSTRDRASDPQLRDPAGGRVRRGDLDHARGSFVPFHGAGTARRPAGRRGRPGRARRADRPVPGAEGRDGSAATPPPFIAGTKPGDYRPTPPQFPAPVFTNWGSVTPFVLGSGRQFRSAPPPPITSAAYARALNQVKRLGQDSSTTRTADQTTLAKFWGAAPIWNVWNQIAQKLAVTRHATLEQTVTVFANLDLT